MEKSLRAACLHGEEDRVRDLVGQGVDINFRDEAGWSGLSFAMMSRHENIAMFLLSQPGIEINVVEPTSVLHMAALLDMREVAMVLLERSDVKTDCEG